MRKGGGAVMKLTTMWLNLSDYGCNPKEINKAKELPIYQ